MRAVRKAGIEQNVPTGQQLANLAAILAGKGNHGHLLLVSGVNRLNHIGGIARVEIAKRMSPVWPSARTCLENTISKS